MKNDSINTKKKIPNFHPHRLLTEDGVKASIFQRRSNSVKLRGNKNQIFILVNYKQVMFKT